MFTGASCTCLAKSKLDFLGRAHHDPPSSCSAGDHCRAWAGTVEFLQLSDHKNFQVAPDAEVKHASDTGKSGQNAASIGP